MSYRHPLRGLLAACLMLAACGGDETTLDGSVELEPLHGSAAIIAEHLIPIPEDEPQAIESESFQRHFERLGRIELSDSIVIGSISRVRIDSRGRLVILDSSSRQVLLFNPDGSHIKTLSTEVCHPGFNWRVSDIVISPTDEILTMQGARQHVLFDAEGECVAVLDLGFLHNRANALTASREIYAFDTGLDQYQIKHFDSSGEELEEIAAQTTMKNFMSRIIAGGMVQDQEGFLYLFLPFRGQAQRISPDGTSIELLGTEPDYYRGPDRDLPDGVTADGMMKAMSDIISQSTLATNIYLLDSDKLLLQFMNNYEDAETSPAFRALDVVSTSGTRLTRESILTGSQDLRIVGARDGLVFNRIDPVEDENGDWGNQGFEVYRFVEGDI